VQEHENERLILAFVAQSQERMGSFWPQRAQ
jgi:hypothetical protein